MPQAKGRVENGNGAQVRDAMNDNFEALFTSSSGNSKPAPNQGGQTWLNTSASPNRFELRDPDTTFVPLRDVKGRVILPEVGYSGSGENADPSLYFDGSEKTGFFKFEDDVIGFTTKGNIHYVLGRTVGDPDKTGLNQKNAFIIGPASYNTTPKVPTIATKTAETGFCVADSGQLHIGTDVRPLTLNVTTDKGEPNLVNFLAKASTKGVIQWNEDDGKLEYLSSSDYRAMENIDSIKGAKAIVNKLKPREYNAIGFTKRTHGFVAHEVQEAFPEGGYAYGAKDKVSSDGEPEHQMVNYGGFTPLLTAALQEAFAEIASLTKRVKALEAKN